MSVKGILKNPNDKTQDMLVGSSADICFFEDGSTVNDKIKWKHLGNGQVLADLTAYNEILLIFNAPNGFNITMIIPTDDITSASKGYYNGAYYNADNAYYAYANVNTGGIASFELLNKTIAVSGTVLKVYAR